MATYYGTSGTDNLVGTSGNDTFIFTVANFGAGDRVSGNGGNDLLLFTTAGDINTAALAGVDQGITIQLANSGTNSIDLEARPDATLIGGDGDDTVNSGGLIVMGGGNDTLTNVGSIQANGGQIDQNDKVQGRQSGSITVATAGTANLANVTGFTALVLGATSGTTTVTLGSGTFASRTAGPIPPQFTITGGSGNDVIDASAESGVAIVWNTGAGSDKLIGGGGYNLFEFSVANLDKTDSVSAGPGYGVLEFTTAGAITANALSALHGIARIELANGVNTIDLTGLTGETVTGGTGNDAFKVTIAGVAGDTIGGGGGTDTLQFTNAGLITKAALSGISGIGQIVLANGANNIDLSGQPGIKLYDGTGNTTAYNAAIVVMGQGNDRLVNVGSIQAQGGYITSADTVTGTYAGSITLTSAGAADLANVAHFRSLKLGLTSGDDTITLGANTLALANPQAVAAPTTQTWTAPYVYAATGSTSNDYVDASADSQALLFDTQAGNDTLIGGTGLNLFRFAVANLDQNDHISVAQGGTGILQFTTAGTITASALSHVNGVGQIVLANGSNSIDLTGLSGEAVTGGSGDDTFTVTRSGIAGDTISGGGGSDTLRFADAGLITKAALAGVSGIGVIDLAKGNNNIDLTGHAGVEVFEGTGNNTVYEAAIVVMGQGTDRIIDVGSIQAQGGFITAADTVKGISESPSGHGGSITITTAGSADLTNVSDFGGLDLRAMTGTNNVLLGATTLQIPYTLPYPSEWLQFWEQRPGLVIDTPAGSTSNDTIDASAENQLLRFETNGGNDTLTGGKAGTYFEFKLADLDQNDTISGGTGGGAIQFDTGGTLAASAFTHVTGIKEIVTAGGAATTLDASYLPGVTVISLGNDTISHAGLVDTTFGGTEHLSSVDSVTGPISGDIITGTGTGTITLDIGSDGSPADLYDLTHVSGFVTLDVTVFGSMNVKLGADTLSSASGGPLTIETAFYDVIDASAESANLTFKGASETSLTGGSGNDVFQFGTYAFADSSDPIHVDGGAGINTLQITDSGTITAAQLSDFHNIQQVLLAPGGDTIDVSGMTALTLTGGVGNDTITAGSGDTFVVSLGKDAISGFLAGDATGHNVLSLDHHVVADYATAMQDAHQVGADVVFTVPGDSADSLTLHNVTLASLTQSDFIFY